MGFPPSLTPNVIVALTLILYGAGNGIWSIARGTLPLTLFGPLHYAPFMGKLAFSTQVAQALVPTIGAIVLAQSGASVTFALLALLTLCYVGLVCLLVAHRPVTVTP